MSKKSKVKKRKKGMKIIRNRNGRKWKGEVKEDKKG